MKRRFDRNVVIGSLLFALVVVLASMVGADAQKFSDWSTPINLGPTVNTASLDAGPAISKDGLTLYFSSDRIGGFGSQDIWIAQRPTVDSPWGTPQNLGPAVNTAALEQVPALSRDEHWLFFNSDRAGGCGGVDIWASFRVNTHDDFGWQPPVNLGPGDQCGVGVNSAFFDGGVSYFENDDGSAPLLFFGSARPGGPGAIDIYASAQQADGSFGPAILVAELSSPQSDRRPVPRFDGLELFLFSDRVGTLGGFDVWVATRETIADAWSVPVNLGPTVNTTSDERQAYLSSDRETLFLVSNRPGGSGGFDLYASKRTKTKGP